MGKIQRTERARRRIRVRYGVGKADRRGFTKNLSEGGVFVHTNNVFKPGTTIQIEIDFPERTFNMWARVVWAKKVPPQLAHVLDCGMGLCFVNPPAEWIDFYAEWREQH